MAPSVLHVCRSVGGGVGRVVGDLVADQVQRGWTVTLACPPGPLADQAVAVGAGHVPWHAERQVSTFPGETRAFRQLYRSLEPDLVHLHAAKPGLVGRLVVRGRVPTVYQPHGWSFALGSRSDALALRWERLALRWTAALLCVSADERRRGEGAGVHHRRTVVVPNGVDLRRFAGTDAASARDEARARLGRDAAPLVVCVGRLCKQKAQDVLLDAWPQVTAAVPGARLVLVGDGPWRAELTDRQVPGVELVGPRTDVVDWLVAADVVVLPSRWEGMALTVLEAMAAGRSLVVSEAEGMREAVGADTDDHGPVAGAVVPIEDRAALADRLVERLRDPDLAAREGAVGRTRAATIFDQRRVDGAVAELVESLVGGQRPTARR